jgi:hypothetical protein
MAIGRDQEPLKHDRHGPGPVAVEENERREA